MWCSACGQTVEDGARFCAHCGSLLQEPGAVRSARTPGDHQPRRGIEDPYKEQIADLKLQLKQQKLALKQITTGMSNRRAQYNETAAFVPRGLLRRGYKMLEDAQLLGPQQQKQRLQQEIARMEQDLLDLQQAQAQWKRQQRQ